MCAKGMGRSYSEEERRKEEGRKACMKRGGEREIQEERKTHVREKRRKGG